MLVALAPDPGPVGDVVQSVAHQQLECRVLLLDHQHLVEAFGELAYVVAFERDRHQQLEQPDPGVAQGLVIGEAQHVQRLAQLAIGVAAGGDTDPVVLGANGHAVELVDRTVLASQFGADLEELALHLERVWRDQAPVRARTERDPVDLDRRDDRDHPIGMDVDGAGAVGDRRDQLETRPDAARSRQGDRVASDVERFLRVAREQQRHVQVDHRGVARRRHRRRLGARVVADDGHDAAVGCRAGEHGMPDRITGAVDAGALAVPHAEDPVVLAVVERDGQLAAHHGGGGEFLVDARLVDDREVGHRAQRPLDLLAERADRRALIAADERRGVEAVATIQADLIAGQPGDRLQARQEHPAVLASVSVGELVLARTRLGPGATGRSSGIGHADSLPYLARACRRAVAVSAR